MAVGAIGDVSPAFKEDAAAPIARGIGMPPLWRGRRGLVDDVEATLEAYKIVPLQFILFCDLHECFGALPRTAHELFLG